MNDWSVYVKVGYVLTVQAKTREEAEALALEMFDPTAEEPYVYESYEVDEND